MTRRILLAALCLPLLSLAADPSKTGLDPERLARIGPRMKQFVDRGELSGIVTLIARKGEVAHLHAAGYTDVEGKKPMRPDSIFQIMSMTKPVTAIGVMMLLEDGRLALTDPVEKHLPEFRGQLVTVTKSDDGTRVVRKPSRPVSIRDLLTHTSGLPYGPPEGLKELNQRMDRTLAEAVSVYSQTPLDFEPGTKWQYSNMGIAILGRLIEVASDQPYERFLTERLFTPLGMKDTFFFPPADKLDRIALVYRKEGNRLVRADGTILGGDPAEYRKGARYPAPEWGLFSTAPDLAALYQMMLNGGIHNGRRYLSRPAVELMTMPHTGDLRAGFIGRGAYGLAWEVVGDPQSLLPSYAPGDYGHGGAFGTQGWISPKREMVRILLVQSTGGGGGTDAKNAFMAMATAAISD